MSPRVCGNSTKKKRSTTHSETRSRHPTPFQSNNPPHPTPTSTPRKPACHAAWTSVRRFGRRFANSHLINGILLFADQPTFDVKGEYLTIRRVCDLMKDVTDEAAILGCRRNDEGPAWRPRANAIVWPISNLRDRISMCIQLLDNRIARQRKRS